jgi:Site-specific recombinases, DNA invertase Pin homologs
MPGGIVCCYFRIPIANRHPSKLVSRSSTPNIYIASLDTANSSPNKNLPLDDSTALSQPPCGGFHDHKSSCVLCACVRRTASSRATIESQIAALNERAESDGTPVTPERQFVDDGFSGATLIRPAFDRLRDLVSVGAIDRIYVHSPDRLARNYAYQVLLIDEWRRHGVELVFLNRPLGQSPEDDLLLQVQGIIAEYERAKIM